MRPSRRIPIAVPWSLRRRLYNLHPGRARRWAALPGLERLEGRRVALTFDDGPDADATPQVLDELERLGVVATFFVLGAEVQRTPDLARRILAGGHELGLHGYAHPRYDLIDAEQAREDLERGLEAIGSATGVRPTWFRPPYGKLSAESHGLCRSLGLQIAYWSAWGLDWEEIGAEQIATETISSLRPGAIVLLHDTARYGRRSNARPTAQALPAIVARGRQLGLSWTGLGEAAHAPA